jgi:hypothetical protein
LFATAEVVTVNVAVVAPAATVTEPGTVALELLDDKVTVVPLGPAAPVRVTVPVEEVPPTTEVGLTARLESLAGEMLRFAIAV